MSTPDRTTSTGPYSRRAPGTPPLDAGPERTHPPISARPAGVPRITLVVAAALLVGILVLVMDNTAVMALSVAVVAAVLVVVVAGVSRIPVLRRLTRARRT